MVVEKKNTFLTKRLVIGSIIAGFLLVIANTAIWINLQIFNTENFTATTVSSISSESSRKALGNRITDEALKNNPVVNNVVGDRLSGLISGLLGTDIVRNLLTASASKMQIYITSSEQQDVDIDFSGLKTTLTQVIDVTRGGEAGRINPENIPDKIVLIEADNVPDLYGYGVAVSWLAPFAVLGAIIALALPYMNDRRNYALIMVFQGAVVALAGLIALLIGPLLRPTVLEPLRNADGRIVVGNLYDAFISTFNQQTLFLVYIGLLVCVVGFAIKMYPRLRKIRG